MPGFPRKFICKRKTRHTRRGAQVQQFGSVQTCQTVKNLEYLGVCDGSKVEVLTWPGRRFTLIYQEETERQTHIILSTHGGRLQNLVESNLRKRFPKHMHRGIKFTDPIAAFCRSITQDISVNTNFGN